MGFCIKIYLIFLLGVATAYALEGFDDEAYPHAINLEKFYLGAQAGVGRQLGDQGFGGRVSIGYVADPFWGVELGFTGYPKTSQQKHGISSDYTKLSSELLAKINFPMQTIPLYGASGETNLYMKLGIAFSYREEKAKLPTGNDKAYKTDLDGAAGVGFSYRLTEKFTIDISGQALLRSNLHDASLIALGLNYDLA